MPLREIQTLAFGAGTPRILYAGMYASGVAQTQDGGEHWRLTPGHFFVEDDLTGGLFEATFPSP